MPTVARETDIGVRPPEIFSTRRHTARLRASLDASLRLGWKDEEGNIPRRLDKLESFLEKLITEVLEPENLRDPKVHPSAERQIQLLWGEEWGDTSLDVDLHTWTGQLWVQRQLDVLVDKQLDFKKRQAWRELTETVVEHHGNGRPE